MISVSLQASAASAPPPPPAAGLPVSAGNAASTRVLKLVAREEKSCDLAAVRTVPCAPAAFKASSALSILSVAWTLAVKAVFSGSSLPR